MCSQSGLRSSTELHDIADGICRERSPAVMSSSQAGATPLTMPENQMRPLKNVCFISWPVLFGCALHSTGDRRRSKTVCRW